MKYKYVYIIIFTLTINSIYGQDNWLTARTGFIVNKAIIIDNPDNFFFDAEIEPSYSIELTFNWTKNKNIYEVGFGFLEIRSLIAFENDREKYGFGRGSSGEIYNYYYFPARMKRRLDVTKWFSLTGGIESSLMYFSNDNLFLVEGNESCFSISDRPFISCRLRDNIEKNKLVFGAGLNASIDVTVGRFRLSIFGKRDWRIGKGYQQNITTEIRRVPSMEVVESHFGSIRPFLHTWNIGIGFGYNLR